MPAQLNFFKAPSEDQAETKARHLALSKLLMSQLESLGRNHELITMAANLFRADSQQDFDTAIAELRVEGVATKILAGEDEVQARIRIILAVMDGIENNEAPQIQTLRENVIAAIGLFQLLGRDVVAVASGSEEQVDVTRIKDSQVEILKLAIANLAARRQLGEKPEEGWESAFNTHLKEQANTKLATHLYIAPVVSFLAKHTPCFSGDLTRLVEKAAADVHKDARFTVKSEEYSLSELLTYALDEYEDFHPQVSEARKVDIAFLRDLLEKFKPAVPSVLDFSGKRANWQDLNVEQNQKLMQQFNHFFNQRPMEFLDGTAVSNAPLFKKGVSSHLKTLCQRAMSHYKLALKRSADKDTPDTVVKLKRTIQMQHWQKEEAPTVRRKVVLAIHGLEDSLKTWQGLAPGWLAEGYEVLAYDQYGHGFDEHRGKNTRLDLHQMHYDFYRQLEHLKNDPTVAEVKVVAHSLGGALVLNSLASLQKTKGDNAPSKVVAVDLYAPAAMDKTRAGLAFNALVNGSDMNKSVKQSRRRGLTRMGSIGIARVIGRLCRFMKRALRNLTKREPSMPVTVYHANDDKLVFADVLTRAATLNSSDKVVAEASEQGGHHFHGPGAAFRGPSFS